jgi:hypothetical protein
MVMQSKFRTDDAKIYDSTMQNVFATATWRPAFMQHRVQEM